ncbi:MAG: ATP synthase gamma chain [Candidatus Daviesbacteria bacterium GW2011_GWA1_41_61]|uniref:ATP synthase gamma chain n=1 Tax=Candidatus Daviesbacteria bacterium GW2011_GWA2_40_9 TaxID=1618424 RepID=A0A0G0U5B0_9BACT|nr:MAG: ATP synthase gamma chain [Candidatus Daviesbacteria bacterium GW2011_GWC1_40_9]KKR82371.1 MAG: ATP synthase gamma chain [Candidatus Daviesbacteria bacterium GW2011_GWA2_40_9]KKR92759.1 MAG: ATP synthase gamma chain [Candidatus Daviesbacteria bacterium GW2011_GWB1_41_15]KKS14518.1 MAG: ATP synthase gamma chain [Candidatus Daviesbacteria bacterium GW2011_GWA1_41_61]
MSTIKQINQVLEDSNSLKLVAQAYSEIAAIKLQKIRKGIEKNRNFFQEISEIFHVVRVAAMRQGIKIATKRRGTLSILLTSNYHFYGSLETQLVEFFILNTTKFKTDRIVVGKTGGEFLQTMGYFHPYQPFIFKDDLPMVEELRKMVISLTGYQQILVYYSRMQSVLIQEPHVVDIVQAPPEHYLKVSKLGSLSYIFEPEIDKMVEFFNTQITQLLFEQTFLESELARTAARLTSMDQAQGNANDLIKTQKKLLAEAKRAIDNNRLLETIATLIGWKKEHHGQID